MRRELKKTSAEEIAKRLCLNSGAIIDNLKQESIDVYAFLQREFRQSDVSANRVFQFVYRSYYGMNAARLAGELTAEYFRLMQETRNGEPALDDVCKKLYHIVDDKKTLQFSFATKLLHTIDNRLPIYDGEVARVFGWDSQKGSFEVKLRALTQRLETIRETYEEILSKGLVQPVVDSFDLKFQHHRLSDVKRLDFICWSAGKVLLNQKKGNL